MRVRIKDLITKREGKYLFVDLIMMTLLVVNLLLILFDLLFESIFIQEFLQRIVPRFHDFYNTHVHQDFLAIDIWFVSVFIIELVVRWIIAVRNHTYHRWFFYPFIHWYDVLGCIPLGSFRFLRVLRIVGLTLRLQKLGVIDLTKTYLYSKFIKYLNILTEEVSDRVVLHVLTGVQDEIKKGTPVLDQIVVELIQPQKAELVEWLSQRLQIIATEAYHEHIDDLQVYLDDKLTSAIKNNPELRNISRIPVLGAVVRTNLEKTVCDLVNHVVDQSLQDLASPNNKAVVDDLTHLILDTFLEEQEDKQLNGRVQDIMIDSLELVKNRVRIQQWKLREKIKEDQDEPQEEQQVA